MLSQFATLLQFSVIASLFQTRLATHAKHKCAFDFPIERSGQARALTINHCTKHLSDLIKVTPVNEL